MQFFGNGFKFVFFFRNGTHDCPIIPFRQGSLPECRPSGNKKLADFVIIIQRVVITFLQASDIDIFKRFF